MRIRYGLCAVGLLVGACGSVSTTKDDSVDTISMPVFDPYAQGPYDIESEEFDLAVLEDVARLRSHIQAWTNLADRQGENLESTKLRKGQRKALQHVDSLLTRHHPLPADAQHKIKEIVSSFHYSFERPLKPIRIFRLFSYFRDESIPRGQSSAPEESSFWTIRNISGADLYTGFNRKKIPDFDNQICRYKEAKTGYGQHPGFDIDCDGTSANLRLGNEIYSGPFNSRIFWAMGYNIDAVDSLPAPRIFYERDLFTEFHSRRPLGLQFQFGPLKVGNLALQVRYDPFEFIQYAIIGDSETGESRSISGQELKRRLLRNIDNKKPPSDSDFNQDFEKQIRYLVLKPSTVETRTIDNYTRVGPWSYDALDHPDHLELRGLIVLAAWVANWDLRMDNNRLRLVRDDDGVALVHFLSDVGSGLGVASNAFRTESSAPEKFAWSVARVRVRWNKPVVQLTGFKMFESNKAFDRASIEDGQWIIRQIANISVEQLLEALAATNMTATEARLTMEKLISRRNSLIRAFGLEKELAHSILPVNRQLNFDPESEPLRVHLKSGGEFLFRNDGSRVEHGHITYR